MCHLCPATQPQALCGHPMEKSHPVESYAGVNSGSGQLDLMVAGEWMDTCLPSREQAGSRACTCWASSEVAWPCLALPSRVGFFTSGSLTGVDCTPSHQQPALPREKVWRLGLAVGASGLA